MGKTRAEHRLTGKQLKFAQSVASGETQTQSYLDAGYKAKDRIVAEVNGSLLMAKPHVAAYVDKLRAEADRKCVMDLVEKRKVLAKIARSDSLDVKDSDRIRAIDIDAKLAGHYAPEELNINGSILGQILAKRD